jgi:hypothetical protein
VSVESFDALTKFLNGDIEYIVECGYSPKILDYSKAELDTSFGDRELKLLTLFGKSDGTLTWGINTYKDGSGSNTVFKIATNYEQAKEILANSIKDYGSINSYIVKEAEKHNVELDQKLLSDYKMKGKEQVLKNIERYKKDIEKQEERLIEIESP